jgi:hypothetical protein
MMNIMIWTDENKVTLTIIAAFSAAIIIVFIFEVVLKY